MDTFQGLGSFYDGIELVRLGANPDGGLEILFADIELAVQAKMHISRVV